MINVIASFQVHGAGTPAGQGQLQANDAIIMVDEKDVTEMKHGEFVQFIKNHSGTQLKIVVERWVIPWDDYE